MYALTNLQGSRYNVSNFTPFAWAVVTLLACTTWAEPPQRYTETIKGTSLRFDLVLIPGGKFVMGSPLTEKGRRKDEGPAHEVEIAPFYLCTTETKLDLFIYYYEDTVTPDNDGNGKEVDAVTGPTPVYGDLTMGWGLEGRPAIAMTWFNAMYFCKWLSKKTGRKYRLPTEAEWEYACRAGTKTAYFFGDDPSKLAEYAWFEQNGEEMTHPVAQKKPNPWGLYDMLGNVREWVFDFYSPNDYAHAPRRNPRGPKTGKVHVARGGAWDSPPEQLRSAAREFQQDWWRAYDTQWPKSKWWLPEIGFIGVRVARSVGE